jgi:sialate O-acetylesterase
MGFELGYKAVSGDSIVFVPANAEIDHNQIKLQADDDKKVIMIRYGWLEAHKANLMNASGLPAFPFRTSVIKSKEPGNRNR